MRLAAILLDHPLGAVPATYALCALMCLNAARLPARVDDGGNLISLFDQNRSLWDQFLVQQGLKFIELSALGSELTEYYVETAIASIHSTASRPEDTNWGMIVSFYDTLIAIRSSPIVALNRAIAIAQRDGPERGLKELDAIWRPRSSHDLSVLFCRTRRTRASLRQTPGSTPTLPSGACARA